MSTIKRVIALGFFDGVHIGHGALLRRTKECAAEIGAMPSVLSFDVHPDTLVFKKEVPLINSALGREDLIRRCYGIDNVVFLHFNHRIMCMPWQDFIDHLMEELNICHIVVGHDFSFGYRGAGTASKLRAYCEERRIGCDVIAPVMLDGRIVSSTYIRGLIAEGEMEQAERYLGHPHTLLEMFCTALGEMLIMLAVMRPEERMDSEAGMLSWASYQADLKNILRSHEHIQIIVIQLLNGRELRNYLGDQKYNEYLSRIADGIRAIRWKHPHRAELYLERPGTIYLITGAEDAITEDMGKRLLLTVGEGIRNMGMDVRPEMRICLIRCPEDLKKAEEIISLGHKFLKIDNRERAVVRACEIVNSRTFILEVHIDEILDRAIREGRIEMVYQPIYDVRSGRFRSAEALARINDPEYGLISPGVFIPAAEAQGLIIPLGDVISNQVFRFVSEHDLDALGLQFVEMNLSVAQCMDSSLPAKLSALQKKYGVDPGTINLEITETTYENIGEIMLENVSALIKMGYSFALDDYGTGYSSIQRINRLPLRLVKIDKSVLDEVSTENGRTILEYTMRMMQKTGKQLVVEGAETREAVEMLESMGCDYIQGFYFAKPLSEDAFVQFLEEKNNNM